MGLKGFIGVLDVLFVLNGLLDEVLKQIRSNG